MKIMDKKEMMEWLHYILVFGILLVSWLPIMSFAGNNIYLTSVLAFFVFVIADQIAHKVILKESFSVFKSVL